MPFPSAFSSSSSSSAIEQRTQTHVTSVAIPELGIPNGLLFDGLFDYYSNHPPPHHTAILPLPLKCDAHLKPDDPSQPDESIGRASHWTGTLSTEEHFFPLRATILLLPFYFCCSTVARSRSFFSSTLATPICLY